MNSQRPQFHKNRFALDRNRTEVGFSSVGSEVDFIPRGAVPDAGHPQGGLRLGHVHLKVRDLNAALPFYTDLLGLKVTERIGRFAFLAIASEHHSLALEEVGTRAESPSRFAVGPTHFAFEVSREADFFALRGKIQDLGMPFTSQNNGISWSFGVRDPDGNEIEIYVDRRHAPDGARYWNGRWFRPYEDGEKVEPTRPSLEDIISVGGEHGADAGRLEGVGSANIRRADRAGN